MGKDSIRLLVAIKKRLNFQTQRDKKIQDSIDGNSLGNRWRSAVLACHTQAVRSVPPSLRTVAVSHPPVDAGAR
jgi:cytochrome c551/c552